jgi:hypothetical protein
MFNFGQGKTDRGRSGGAQAISERGKDAKVIVEIDRDTKVIVEHTMSFYIS